MRTFALLAALVLPAAAFAAAPSAPAKDPAAPKDDLKFMGDPHQLHVLKDTPAVTLYTDEGEGTDKSPRHVYFKAKMDGKPLVARPTLLFVEPSDGTHPSGPEVEEMSFSQVTTRFGGKPFQVWIYPDKVTTTKGMAALVLKWEKGKAQALRPLFWWGAKRDDFDSLTQEEAAAAVAAGAFH